MDKIEKLIVFLREKYPNTQSFDCRNTAGDSLRTVYSEDGVMVDYCDYWDYIEIFGLTEEEYENVVKAFNQSQKQPEGEKELMVEMEDSYPVMHGDEEVKSEKQEEWREELRKALDGKITIFEDLYRILKEKELTGWESEAIGNIIEIEIDCIPEEYSLLVNHISQLLSEREREAKKEVLNVLKLRLNDCVVYLDDKGVINSVNREIDKLLKGEE